jgi:hypothetical protein
MADFSTLDSFIHTKTNVHNYFPNAEYTLSVPGQYPEALQFGHPNVTFLPPNTMTVLKPTGRWFIDMEVMLE